MIICLGTTPTVQRTMTFTQLHVGDVNRAKSVTETASGKSLNVARVLHTLGEPLIATGFVGGDSGAFIREDLTRAGIAHDFVSVGPKTRTCVTVIDEAAGAATELIEESKRVEEEAFERLSAKLGERWRVRRRIPNHCSTGFIQEQWTGVKWATKRGWAASHGWTSLPWWTETLSASRWIVVTEAGMV